MGAAERGTGITTTCLWMDIPALTLAGKTSVSRAGRSILCASGLAEPVTDTPGQFVEAATALARDADRFRDLRLTMRRLSRRLRRRWFIVRLRLAAWLARSSVHVDIHPTDHHNLQRPETVESLMYMYRITGDEIYRHWGWEMFKNFVKHTAIVEEDRLETEPASPETSAAAAPRSRIRAFTCLSDANSIPPVQRDDMESFWLAETLKYFYLLFSDREFIPLETTVFNTEAHIFPRFQMGQTLKTGWSRKAKKTKNDQVS